MLHELRISDSKPPVILQKLWLERSTLQIRKKILYNEDGAPLSRIYYRDYVRVGEGEFPQTIILERPLEGYQVNFKIENVQTDIKLNPEMFTLKIPEDAKIVNLKSSEKK